MFLFFFFLSVSSCPSAKPLLSPPFHPHSLLSDCRSVQVGCTRFSRCCYLIIDLVPPFEGNWSRTCRSHLISAVELGCSDAISLLSCTFFFFFSCMLFFFLPVFPSFPQRNFEPGSPRKDDRQLRRPLAPPVLWGALHSRPRRASLCGYCAGVRTPLHSPTTDAVGPPTFWPPQQPLVSWHFSSSLGKSQSPSPQITILPKGSQNIVCPLHQHRSQIAVSFFTDVHLRLALSGVSAPRF
jgi:hypothetical protein